MGDILQKNNGKFSHHNILEAQEQKNRERKRNILLLIRNFLVENNLVQTAAKLSDEAHLQTTVEICDNIDLDTILQEYTSYYFSKFGKYPKICKKSSGTFDFENEKKAIKSVARHKLKKISVTPQIEKSSQGDDFEIDIRPLSVTYGKKDEFNARSVGDGVPYKTISLQPLETLNDYPGEWKEMYDLICKEIIPQCLNTKWSDCIGLESTVNFIQEAVLYPLDYPEFFVNIKPWKGILLYGPPGTGKTLLAKALACEARTIFINVTASTFISKWRGDSEKLIRILFEIAKHNCPCTIFIDELDALSSKREERQHEASRRFKSELLIQMDGILQSSDRVFILATSNIPWEIDSAILRRFDKKILVDLPGTEARAKMFEKFLHLDHWQGFHQADYNKFAEQTEHFSGNDIKLICKNALMSAVRKRIAEHQKKGTNSKEIYYLVHPTINDVQEAIKNARTSAPPGMIEKYAQWQANYGGI